MSNNFVRFFSSLLKLKKATGFLELRVIPHKPRNRRGVLHYYVFVDQLIGKPWRDEYHRREREIKRKVVACVILRIKFITHKEIF